MSELAVALWGRAKVALQVAINDIRLSPDAAGSRAYYAAFYAVSAHFALQGRQFRKHSAVETAVHRDLVKPGLWPEELGQGYSALAELRTLGDYGDLDHVSPEEALDAVGIATDILRAVSAAHPDQFAM